MIVGAGHCHRARSELLSQLNHWRSSKSRARPRRKIPACCFR